LHSSATTAPVSVAQPASKLSQTSSTVNTPASAAVPTVVTKVDTPTVSTASAIPFQDLSQATSSATSKTLVAVLDIYIKVEAIVVIVSRQFQSYIKADLKSLIYSAATVPESAAVLAVLQIRSPVISTAKAVQRSPVPVLLLFCCSAYYCYQRIVAVPAQSLRCSNAYISNLCTAVLDRTENHTPIFQTENIKTDNNSITSDIEETNVYQENNENYLSTADINQSFIIED
jgi:hypothetical protein